MRHSCSILSAEESVSPLGAFDSQTAGGMEKTNDRTIVYIFVGCIIIGDKWWKIASGALVVLIGIGYVALEFIPSIEPPANMR